MMTKAELRLSQENADLKAQLLQLKQQTLLARKKTFWKDAHHNKMKTNKLVQTSKPHLHKNEHGCFRMLFNLIRTLFIIFFIMLLLILVTHVSLEADRNGLHPSIRESAPLTQISYLIDNNSRPFIDQVREHFSETERAGQALARLGHKAYHPVIFLPGIISTVLEVWDGEKCGGMNFRDRVWGDMYGMKIMLSDRECWMRHMRLNASTGLDPENIKLRPADGLTAADFLGPLWVWAKIIENLADVGYEPSMLHLAAYDWRLAYSHLEARDQYFSRLKLETERLVFLNEGRKVAYLAHSMGGPVGLHFLQWVDEQEPGWTDRYVAVVAAVGAPFLGCPKTVASVISGEMKDTAMLGSLDSIRQRVLTRENITDTLRTFGSIAGMFPKGKKSSTSTIIPLYIFKNMLYIYFV